MDALLSALGETQDFVGCGIAIDKGETPVAVVGCSDTQKSQVIAALFDKADYRLVITYDEVRAREITQDLVMYDPEVIYYPAKDLIFFSADVHGRAITQERLAIIKRLRDGVPTTIVTTVDGGMDACLPFSYYERYDTTLNVGDTLDLKEFGELLTEMGYEHVAQVTSEGEFSVRGGIVDIYPEAEETPYRIELWDDEIDSIRSIDAESQRSIEQVSHVKITPATEIMISKEDALKGLHTIMQEGQERVRLLKKNGSAEAAGRLKNNLDSFKDSFDVYHGLVNLESYIRYFV
ncbi:MAG TPA: transcription-repair coupling factor, partial [Lachnospiraceae bacterium]|nr:transcription-repair coupling factor [Lachnospiraceae bacterium]